MRFAWLVARRYLRSPYKPAVLRLVTMFSVVGIAAGVATLVIALSMNTGFRRTIQDRLLGVSAHVNLTRPGAEGIEDYGALADKLSHVPGVRSVAPAIYLTVLLSGRRSRARRSSQRDRPRTRDTFRRGSPQGNRFRRCRILPRTPTASIRSSSGI